MMNGAIKKRNWSQEGTGLRKELVSGRNWSQEGTGLRKELFSVLSLWALSIHAKYMRGEILIMLGFTGRACCYIFKEFYGL
jgi:hypothetical protein